MEPIGLYLHVPFCQRKCSYCDFYSVTQTELREAYVCALLSRLEAAAKALKRPAKTLYFGGGTPSLLGGASIARLTKAARSLFGLEGAEITLECNPGTALDEVLERAAEAGVNRVSLGIQAFDDQVLSALGRTHTAAQAAEAVETVRRAGIQNFSLDVMLALPGQTKKNLSSTLDFCADSGAAHISAYLLKVEPGTPLSKANPLLPSEDEAADLYLFACERLERAGFFQYEISNFAKPGKESRHNLIYWDCGEYLGLGPAAHSLIHGRRFYFPRDLRGFLAGDPPVFDGPGGQFEEYAMLRLRLSQGLTEEDVQRRFGHGIPPSLRKKAEALAREGLAQAESAGIRLTRRGMLVQNSVLGFLL